MFRNHITQLIKSQFSGDLHAFNQLVHQLNWLNQLFSTWYPITYHTSYHHPTTTLETGTYWKTSCWAKLNGAALLRNSGMTFISFFCGSFLYYLGLFTLGEGLCMSWGKQFILKSNRVQFYPCILRRTSHCIFEYRVALKENKSTTFVSF